MRLKLKLIPKERTCRIPINYQYPMSSFIYKTLYTSSREYAEFLHDHGYISENGKPLKLFNFSYLSVPRRSLRVKQGIMELRDFPRCTMYISSPFTGDFIEHLVIGLFQHQEVAIGSKRVVGRFTVTEIESLAPPVFAESQRFTCLSPFVCSTMRDVNGTLMPHFLRADDPGLDEAVRRNLIRKYSVVHQAPPADDRLTFTLDADYIKRKGGPNRVTKLITIKEDDACERTHIKAVLAPFTFTGSTELMATAWDCGIGERNSLGFGMVDVVGKNTQ